MPAAAADTPSPFASILAWSTAWPEWQRDALRRIVQSGPLDDEALKELAALCRSKHGLLPASSGTPTAVPLTAVHTPGGADGTVSVSLTNLSHLHNVGQLPSDQELDFGNAPGLTVIYGENGAGKSGYARVIKKACRARDIPQDIKPNVFAPDIKGPAKAKIGCRVGSASTQIDWTDGSASDPRLSNIFVFDSFSARVHVGEDGPACFKPRGLDVLPELAKACDKIKAGLQQEIVTTLAEIRKTSQVWNYSVSTTVGKLIRALDAAANPEAVDAAAIFTAADEKRLAEINATLSTDPKLKAADTTAAAKRIRSFALAAQSRAVSVDDTAMQNLGEAIEEVATTAAAAAAASGPEVKPGELPWGSNQVWRELWKAAQKFSETHAYPDKTFPVTEAGAKCVLCQQTLQANAIDRYARFNKFISDETRKQADAARNRVAALKLGVDLLRPIGTEAASIKADLDRDAAGTFVTVETFAKAVDARISHAQNCLKDGARVDAPPLPPSPCSELLTLADALDKRAKDELAAADPEYAKALASERDELTDRKWLRDKKDEVKAQAARYAHVARLEKCQEDCASRPVSDRAKELDRMYVTEAFCTAFAQECDELEVKTLPVSLSAVRVAKGESHFAVVVSGATNANVEDIASEGEHRCIALASFLAELSQASHKSALVFDDPVSSLDNKRRNSVAARLAREATRRQVIVFTHDLAFICDLDSAARSASLQIHYQHIERLAGKPGRALPGLPWDAQSYKAQIKTLNEQIGKADKTYKTQGESEYREAAMPVIGRVRGACERIIEQHLLNGVIKRHDSRIDVKSTVTLSAVSADQWKSVHSIWKECSNIIEAHATPLSGPTIVPHPDRLKAWMQVLEKTVEDVKVARESKSTTVVSQPGPVPPPSPST